MRFRLKKKEKREVKRITEYLVSGGAFFWSGYATFFLMDKVLGLSLFFATSIAYLVGWTVNFILQRYWVFNNPKLKKHELEVTGRYLVISFVNLFINYAILGGLKMIGITPYIGQFISSGFFTVWNYLWYKFWVFPSRFPRSAARRSRTPQKRSRRATSLKSPVLTRRTKKYASLRASLSPSIASEPRKSGRKTKKGKS
jgi:putative flippase GtrA